MKKILSRINELFDSEELKSQFEVPYLKGEIPNLIKKWKNVDIEEDMSKKILFKYPILDYFMKRVVKSESGNKADIKVFCAEGDLASDKNRYYGQIAFSVDSDVYFVNIIFKDVNENNQLNWVNKTFNYDSIDDVYNIVSIFLDNCIELNIIKPKNKLSLSSN